MPFAVRNMEPGPAVFSDLSNNIALEWARAGDEDGNDVQQVPDVLAENVNFLRAVQKGVFVVEEASPEIEAALTRQAGAWRRKQDEFKEMARAAISEETRNDIITVPCIGPGPKGECGEPVMVKEKSREERPPLCQRHARLINEFVVTETDKIVDGRAVRTWSRAGMAPREQQQV